MKFITSGLFFVAGAICYHGYATSDRPDLRVEEAVSLMIVCGVLGVACFIYAVVDERLSRNKAQREG